MAHACVAMHSDAEARPRSGNASIGETGPLTDRPARYWDIRAAEEAPHRRGGIPRPKGAGLDDGCHGQALLARVRSRTETVRKHQAERRLI